MQQNVFARVLHAPPRHYTITELCREFETTPRTLHFYEEKGLLHPGRRNRTRVYSQKDRARLQLILRGRKVGLSIAQIASIRDLHEPGGADRAQADLALQLFRARLARLEQIRWETDAAIRTLTDACTRLQTKAVAPRAPVALAWRAP
jgi:DNA-binding transcriptional MerR regulator